ncbi:pectinesterase 1, partial [Morus notabilis]|uniref:pectinesterase 1 n=1 Tax=Morus notabilis TaxID=981085 RepID=UPI000CED0499
MGVFLSQKVVATLLFSNTSDPEVIFKLCLRVAIDELSRLSKYPDELIAKTNDTRLKEALGVCKSVLDDAMDRLNDSVSSMEVRKEERLLSSSKIDDMQTWLSTTITDQETCLDALDELNSTITPQLRTKMQNSTEFASNSLAIVAKIIRVLAKLNVPIHRRLLGQSEDGFPEWLSAGDRRLLQDDQQNVLDKNKWNVMMIGDGKTKTIVSGSLNFIDGTPTFHTTTF